MESIIFMYVQCTSSYSLFGPRDDDCVKKKYAARSANRAGRMPQYANETRPERSLVTAIRVLPFRYGVELNNAFCA